MEGFLVGVVEVGSSGEELHVRGGGRGGGEIASGVMVRRSELRHGRFKKGRRKGREFGVIGEGWGGVFGGSRKWSRDEGKLQEFY